MRYIKSVCQNCPVRAAGCHTVCAAYGSERAENAKRCRDHLQKQTELGAVLRSRENCRGKAPNILLHKRQGR